MLLYSCGKEKFLCIGYDVINYLIIFIEKILLSLFNIVFGKKLLIDFIELSIYFIDEIGYFLKLRCLIKRSKFIYFCCFKICLLLFVEIWG